KNRLEVIDCLRPSEVLNISIRFGYIPGHNSTVRKLSHKAGSRHARLEKNADGWNAVYQVRRGLTQCIKAADRDASLVARRRPKPDASAICIRRLAEANRSANPH